MDSRKDLILMSNQKSKDTYKLLIKEELDKEEIKQVKQLIEKQLIRLFYQLYVKKTFWSK